MNTLLGVVLETGKYGVDVMALLDKANTQAYATAVVLLVVVIGINCLSGAVAKKF